MRRRLPTIAITLAAALLVGGCPFDLIPALNPDQAPTGNTVSRVFEFGGERFVVQEFASGLEVPWSMKFTPDGARLLVTERIGRLAVLDSATGDVLSRTDVPFVVGALPESEVGLMGLEVSPDFANDNTVYLAYTSANLSGFQNVIDRFEFVDGALHRIDEFPMVGEIPAAFLHDGLRLRFGPDGMLYATTGDALDRNSAQNLNSLAGKILRIEPDGGVPADNPFGSLVFSFGHRNPQGIAFDPNRGFILSTEHGPSGAIDGGLEGLDEVNAIRAGANYGWPEVVGSQTADGVTPPIFESGDDAIAPAGAVFYFGDRFPAWQGAFLFVGLRGASLWVMHVDDTDPSLVLSLDRGLQNEFGRLRDVTVGPDGYVYLATSNRDGRGTPGPNDDRILRLLPVR